MIGFEKIATSETEDANVGSETSGRVTIESVIGSDSYSARENKEKKRLLAEEKSNLTPN